MSAKIHESAPYRKFAEKLIALRTQAGMSRADLAEKLGICFADAEGWDLPVSYDGVHLSEEGHRLFAERLKQELDSL